MTGQLEIRIECGSLGYDLPHLLTHLVGNIYAVEVGGTSRRQIVLPVGWNAEPVSHDLPAGRYVVEASLPAGQILTEDVEVEDGQTARVQFMLNDSPYESHTLQYLVGNLEPSAVYHGPQTYPVPNSEGSQPFPSMPQPPLEPPGRGADPEPDPEPIPEAELVLLSRGPGGPLAIEPLNALADQTSAEASRAVESLLDGAQPPAPVPVRNPTSQSPIFVLDEAVTSGLSPGSRYHYLRASSGDAAYLVTAPWPWPGPTGELHPIEVMLNLRQGPTGSAVSVAVQDPLHGGGLGYLAAGSLEKAAVLFADVESMLFGKLQNPLAAAAAGYVLIGTESTGQEQRWDPWLDNLRRWFPELSDGAVLWGARLLRRADGPADAGAAKAALLEGYRRGLPVYTLGLTWLVDGLSAFPDDPECVHAVEQVRRLAWAVDTREPFVVLRLGRKA